MNINQLLAACFIAVGAITVPVSAATYTIDFSSLPVGDFSTMVFGAYSIERPDYGQVTKVFVTSNGQKAIGDDAIQSDEEDSLGTGFILSRVDGAAFDVDSIVYGMINATYGQHRVTTDPYGSSVFVEIVSTDGQMYSGPALTNFTSLFFDAYTDLGSLGISSITVSSTAGNVPEPATWALMIGGFGLAGTALRRRRNATSVSLAA